MNSRVLCNCFIPRCLNCLQWCLRFFKRCVKQNLQCASVRFKKYFVNFYLLFAVASGVLLTSGCSTFEGNPTHQNFAQSSSTHSLYQLMGQADNAYSSEDWVQASNSYREVIEKIPNDAYAWFRMGNSLTQLGQYAQAVIAYETSLAADNGQFKAWFNLSTTHLLNAKVVTLNALRSIGMNDPSRYKVERRLDILTALLN
jgi:tetratricopeptide (TPR) repeat protein